MGRAAIRGICGGILTAAYMYILLIFTYFNYNSNILSLITVLVLPLGCTVIAACFLEKERVSKFLVSVVMYSVILAALIFGGLYLNIPGLVERVFYGVPSKFPYDIKTTAVLAVSAASALTGMLIGLAVSIRGSIKIKRFIDSLEVPKTGI